MTDNKVLQELYNTKSTLEIAIDNVNRLIAKHTELSTRKEIENKVHIKKVITNRRKKLLR